MSSPVDLGNELLKELNWFANHRTLDEKVKSIKLLIDAGADLEIRNRRDENALMYVLWIGDVMPKQVLNMLLFAGADADCRYLKGYKATPLMYATIEEAKQLIDAGADVSLKSIGPTENALYFYSVRFSEFRRRKVEDAFILDILIEAF